MSDPSTSVDPHVLCHRVRALLDEIEAHQSRKVLDLARRLVPGLTAEDIRNPHDFPDLADPDWHFEDGQLAGIQAVRIAVCVLLREILQHGEDEETDARAQDRERGGSVLPTLRRDGSP